MPGTQGTTTTRTSLCWKEGKEVVEDNTNYRGARMVIPIGNLIDILEELKMLRLITIFFERLNDEAIEQRLHQTKGLM